MSPPITHFQEKKITGIFVTMTTLAIFTSIISGGAYLFREPSSKASTPIEIAPLFTLTPVSSPTPEFQTTLPDFPLYPNAIPMEESYQSGPISGFAWSTQDSEETVSNWYKEQLENGPNWLIQQQPLEPESEQLYIVSYNQYDVYIFIKHEEPHQPGEITDETIIEVKAKVRE